MSRRHKGDASLEPTLPITPMLDMAFQLLAFFVMTYHPSDLEGQMDLSLPSEKITQAEKKENVDPSAQPDPKPLDLPANLTVIVRAHQDARSLQDDAGKRDRKGDKQSYWFLISDVRLQDDAGPQSIDVDKNLKKLLEELKKRHASVENKDNIKLQADGKLKWKAVIEVMDVCHKAGFKNISFVPPPDYGMSGQ